MRVCFEGDRFLLAGGQAVGLCDQQGARVEVVHGELWVTQEGDRRDFVVGDGEAFRVERRGLTVLHALAPSHVRIDAPPAGEPWLRRFGRRMLRHLDPGSEGRARDTGCRA